MDPYHGLVWHSWTPSFAALIGQWNCKKQTELMVDLLDCWESLLPDWIMENILDLFVLPKIQKEVDDWNPLTDLIPIHSWIHPWLPRLSKNRIRHLKYLIKFHYCLRFVVQLWSFLYVGLNFMIGRFKTGDSIPDNSAKDGSCS